MESGTAVVVVKDDRIIHEAYFGYADIAAGRAVDDKTVFYIASTTKAFLAQAALLAEERGHISTETTLQELFSVFSVSSGRRQQNHCPAFTHSYIGY